jgi:hypothetical protein
MMGRRLTTDQLLLYMMGRRLTADLNTIILVFVHLPGETQSLTAGSIRAVAVFQITSILTLLLLCPRPRILIFTSIIATVISMHVFYKVVMSLGIKPSLPPPLTLQSIVCSAATTDHHHTARRHWLDISGNNKR